MPKQPKPSSTDRRHKLASYIDSFGKEMVKKCSTCAKHGRVCRIHVRSGKCSACVRLGQRCDARVTESEFDRLLAQKEKLRKEIKESRETQEVAFKAHEEALEKLRVARAREDRLRQQMDLLDKRAGEAIAVEERDIEETELLEEVNEASSGPLLSASSWGAWADLPANFWENPIPSTSGC